MCIGCLVENKVEWNETPLVKQGVEAVKRVYEFSLAGGSMHCQLDDYNIGDEFFDEQSRRYITTNKSSSDAQKQAELHCFGLFKQMTLNERGTCLAIYDGGDKDMFQVAVNTA